MGKPKDVFGIRSKHNTYMDKTIKILINNNINIIKRKRNIYIYNKELKKHKK